MANPVPSDQLIDLQSNVQTTDSFVNSDSLTVTARPTPTNPAGKVIKTLAGINADVELALQRIGVQYSDPITDWTALTEITAFEAHRYPATTGDLYIPTAPLPFTTGATFDTDNWTLLQGLTIGAIISDTAIPHIFNTVADVTSDAIVFTSGKQIYVIETESTYTFNIGGTPDGDYVIDAGNGNTIVKNKGDRQLARVGRPASPTVVSGGAGGLTGTYYYMVSMVTDNGETEVSVPSSSIVLSSEQADVTIPVSSDNRVIARKIYRTVAGESESTRGRLVATVNDNTTTVFADNVVDGSLGVNAKHLDTTGALSYDDTNVVENTGGLSTKIGRNTIVSDAAYACTAFGAFSLESNDGGVRNTAVGTDALLKNIDGDNNTGVGVHAGNDNVSGNNNTSVGLNSGFKNTSSDNTAVGSNAFAENVSGQRNTSIGSTASQLKTAGDDNTAIGSEANFAAGTATGGTCVGRRSGYNITNGNFNSVFGYFASFTLTTGSSNTSFGGRSLYSNETGSGNVGIGWNAGYYETDSNHLWIDNQPRADLADGKVKALVYGEFGADRESQKIDFNGQVNPLAGLGLSGRDLSAGANTINVDDNVLTCNGAITLTLPTGKPDKILTLRNVGSSAIISATSNIQPIGGGVDSVAILPASNGAWAIIRCRATGTDWEIIAQG